VGPLGGIMGNIVIQNLVVQADSTATAERVVADMVSQAQTQAKNVTGRSSNYPRFLPGVAQSAVRRPR
jgi:hypothetical protein